MHQTNCLTRRAAGLAHQIFTRFPHANCYANRTRASVPGTIQVMGNGTTQRYVVNMHAQFTPGRGLPSRKDGELTRIEYFRQCLHWLLQHITKHHNGQSVTIGFPARIGCGLAGGNWNIYIGMIEYFTRMMLKTTHHGEDTVTIYALPINRDIRRIYKF